MNIQRVNNCIFNLHDERVRRNVMLLQKGFGFRFTVFNATFNNISVISWWSVSLVEETGENHRPVASNRQTLSHNVVLSIPCHEQGSNSQLLVVMGTDCTGSCKSNDHTITSTTASLLQKGQNKYH